MTIPRRIQRYSLVEAIESPAADSSVILWRGHDDVLDREVSIRLIRQDDPRSSAVLAAARAAALVEDRRLLRVLDVLTVPASTDEPAMAAVVSEWATGSTVQQSLVAGRLKPLPLEEAVSIVDDVARAVSAGLSTTLAHGRLRPSSVIVTDAGEVRVRGLAVDAALWGPLNPSLGTTQADVDGLGSLLYLLLTGMWPGEPDGSPYGLPRAPRAGGFVLPPSRVSASIPRNIDDCIARSVHDAARPRGVTTVRDAGAFAVMLGVARDYVGASLDSDRVPYVDRPALTNPKRIAISAGAVAAAALVGFIGWQVVAGGPSAWQPSAGADSDAMLTASATPTVQNVPGIEQVLAVAAATSFDPNGDDNRNGKPDGRKGRENEQDIPLIFDEDPMTAWTSDRYRSFDADGKGGVGIVLDLGSQQAVSSVSLAFADVGAQTEVRVANKVYRDPGTWRLLAQSSAGGQNIDLRTPRPLVGRYVLLWFPKLPESASSPGAFEVSVSSVTVKG